MIMEIMEALSACIAENKSLKEGQKLPTADENTVANKAVCELLGLKAGAPAADVTAKIMETAIFCDGVRLSQLLELDLLYHQCLLILLEISRQEAGF